MDRRRFLLTSLSGAVAGPLAAGAQRPEEGPHVGILDPGIQNPEPSPQPVPDTETLQAIAHNLRHILVAVRSYSQLMLEKMALTDPLRRCPERLLEVADLADETIAYLRAIAGPCPSARPADGATTRAWSLTTAASPPSAPPSASCTYRPLDVDS